MLTFKKIALSLGVWVLLSGISRAANTRNDLHIIPESQSSPQEIQKIITEIWDISGKNWVLDNYNEKALELEKKGDLGTAFATGVFSWKTIIKYIAYLMKFMSQLGLLIWGIMVLYAGYQYATVLFGGKGPNDAKNAIKNAVIGILVIIFSYAIFRALVAMFIE